MSVKELNAALAKNKAKNEALAGNSIVDQVDINTIANEKPETIAPPKKKSSGPKSYKTAYDEAGGSAKLGDYGAWEKKAKAWNTKKYGTTEPTAKANKMTGGSKTELAKEHTASQTKVERIEPKPAAPIATETQANNRLQQAIASANAPASLMSGTKTRREQRQANRQQRQSDRQGNRLEKYHDRLEGDRNLKKEERYRTKQQRQNQKQTGNKFVSGADAQAASDRTKALMTPQKTKQEIWNENAIALNKSIKKQRSTYRNP